MTSLIDIQTELVSNVKFQEKPVPMDDSDYLAFTIKGIKRLYTDEGIEDNFIKDFDKVSNTLAKDLTLTESEYACVSAEIAFRNQIKDDVNAIIGYSTNAISITGANTPFKNLQGTIDALELRLAKLAFKFTHKAV